MSDPIVAVCMPIARAAHPSTMRGLVKLLGRAPFNHFYDVTNMQVDVARNMITETACNNPAVTHLLWIDDDMTFTQEDAERLLAHDVPIVGGLCFGRRHPYPPILVHLTERGFAFDYDYPKNALVEVDATGAAFLLVKKEVFFEIHKKFPEGPWTPIGVGEDISFCRRARDAGYKILVDTSVKIGHIAEITIEEASAERNRIVRVNPWHPPRAELPSGPPVATIVIPTYNQKPKRLRAAVRSAIDQTVPVEIIVVDNGSTSCVWCGLDRKTWGEGHPCDGPPTYPHLRVIRIPDNAGSPWPALNAGILDMTTSFFTWLSSDDLLYPHKIERQMAGMNGDVASFHGFDIMFSDWGIAQTVIIPSDWKTMEEQRASLAQSCWINGLTVMLHRTVLDTVKLPNGDVFDSRFLIAADWDLWNRIAISFRWRPVNEILATRREYENASLAYARDPKMRERWIAEDAAIRKLYGGGDPPVSAEKFLDDMAALGMAS